MKEFPMWATILYRGVRAAISAGLVMALATQADWGNPKEAGRILLVAFGTGFLVSFGKWLRSILDEKFGYDEKSIPAKVMPI